MSGVEPGIFGINLESLADVLFEGDSIFERPEIRTLHPSQYRITGGEPIDQSVQREVMEQLITSTGADPARYIGNDRIKGRLYEQDYSETVTIDIEPVSVRYLN